MVALLFFLLKLLLSPFRPISRLEAENAALRRQLIVLQRQVRGRIQFTNSDRLFFLQLYRWFPSIVGDDDHPARDAGAMIPLPSLKREQIGKQISFLAGREVYSINMTAVAVTGASSCRNTLRAAAARRIAPA